MTVVNMVPWVGRAAKERAEKEARRVPWRMLEAFRNQYIDSECFLFWLRSIEEAAGGLPESAWKEIKREYPVFLDDELPHLRTKARDRVWKQLDEWIFDNVFAEVRREGWMEAVVYYAVPDLRYLRSEAYWLKCAAEWKRKKPPSHPSFERWRQAAFRCSELGIAKPSLREMLRPADHIAADRFAEAVESWVDWGEFASWARTGLEQPYGFPQSVRKELRRRCPGFLEDEAEQQHASPSRRGSAWLRLVDWISTHSFSRPRREGWLHTVRYYAQLHPHWVCMMRYSSQWRTNWRHGRINTYPSLAEWRQAVDDYIE